MKRYLLFISCFWLIFLNAYGAITGSGTFASPYTGTITSSSENRTFSGTAVYFNQIEVSGGTLTISSGTTLYAANTGAYILISDNGILLASGTSGSGIITFTADNDGDGITGSSETWQNISFIDVSYTSLIEYAVIENGSGNPGSTAGGGIEIYNGASYSRTITLRNSTIRHCSAITYGGAISVTGIGDGVVMSDLTLYDNTASTGSAIHIFTDVSLGPISISNCQIYNNHYNFGYAVLCDGEVTLTGCSIYNNDADGVKINSTSSVLSNCLIYDHSGNVYDHNTGLTIGTVGFSNVGAAVINSNLVNNGTNLNISDGHTATIMNSVLWGGTTQFADPGAGGTFVNCGVQGVSLGGSNVNLSNINNNPLGPNFADQSSDFHISTWNNPLTDAGTASYSSISAPATDLEGSSRIHTTDIGAYEFLYYRWTGLTDNDWGTTGNWSGSLASIPTTISSSQVIIPDGCSNYPTTSSLTLSSGSRAVVDPGARLTVTGATSVNDGCTFILRSGSAGSANFITGTTPSLSGSGTFNVELYLSGSTDPTYNWHYVMTPVDGHSKTALTTGMSNTNNLINYLESSVSTDRMTGWQWHDGFDSGYGPTQSFSYLYRNQGYNVLLRNLSGQTANFSGNILGGADYTFSNLTCGSGDAYIRGWNLIGNPFTAGVDVEAFSFSNLEPTIYYTSGNNFNYYNTNTHLGSGPRYISGMQGFFVHALSGGGSMTIPAGARQYQTTPVLKSANITSDYPLLKFNISDGAALTDVAFIYFFKDATPGFEGEYDVYKLLSEDPSYPQIYTTGNNLKFAMNGLPVTDQKTIVPLNVRIGTAQNYTINVLNLENLDDYRVTLVDGDKKTDLKTNPAYTFYAAKGTITNMSIIFENTLTGITVPEKDQTDCWYSKGVVRIKAGVAGFEDNSSVLIYDMNGKVVFRRNNLSIGQGEIIDIPVNLSRGIYVTSVINNNKKLVKKIVVTH